jgi:hypothetical protein
MDQSHQNKQSSSEAMIEQLYEQFPALKVMFQRHRDKIIVHGDVLTNLTKGISIKSELMPINIFHYGYKQVEKRETFRTLIECIEIIGTFSSSSSFSSLLIERTRFAIRVTKDKTAYEFSLIIQPTLTHLCHKSAGPIFDGESIVFLSALPNETISYKYPPETAGQTLKSYAAKNNFCLPDCKGQAIRDFCVKIGFDGYVLYKENVSKMVRELFKQPHNEYLNFPQEAMEYAELPPRFRDSKHERFYFGEHAFTYHKLNKEQLHRVILKQYEKLGKQEYVDLRTLWTFTGELEIKDSS